MSWFGLVRRSRHTFQTLTLSWAVGTVLVVRLYLELTGFPSVGGRTLHIAHVLWGGLLMFVAGNMFLVLYGRAARRLAAIGLGIGFGLFIDEVGKFVTRDNDYFFRPAPAIMYVVFIAFYLGEQAVARYARQSDQAQMFGAIEELEEVIRRDFEPSERAAALDALDAVRESPAASAYRSLAEDLREVVRRQAPVSPHRRSRFVRTLSAWRTLVTRQPRYRERLVRIVSAVIVIAFIKTLLQEVVAFGLVYGSHFFSHGYLLDLAGISEGHLTATALQTAGTLIAAAFAMPGLLALRRDTDLGLHLLGRAILILIVFPDVFLFYVAPITATIDVLLNLTLLTVIHTLETGNPAFRGKLAPDGASAAAHPADMGLATGS